MTEEQWWKDDAARINRMSQWARDHGKMIKVSGKIPMPKLNPDGSMKEEKPPKDAE